MDFFFDEKTYSLVSAADYLRRFPGREAAPVFSRLGIVFYAIRDCLCLGGIRQAIAPAHSGALPVLFSQSCPYLSHEYRIAAQVRETLHREEAVIEVDRAVPLAPFGSVNFWHFTLESLPKLLLLEEAGYDGPYILPVREADHGFLQGYLDMFGIGPERVLPAGPLYRVKELILPERLSGFNLVENMPLAGFLRERLLAAAGTLEGEKRLYVRRVGRRKVANEEDLLSLLRRYDFEVMVPEDFSVAEQWRTMSNTAISIMPHGANCTLSLLQKPGSTYIELFSNRYICYSNLHAVRLLGLRYHSLVEDLDVSCYPGEKTGVADFLAKGLAADITVDLRHAEILLEAASGVRHLG